MTRIPHALAATATALLALVSMPGVVHAQMDNAKMNAAQMTSLTDGEIRKVDKDAGKVTIKHGEIKHMDMPPMSMVFNVKDKAMLDKVQVGEKIQFIVVQEAGKMVVTDIQPVH